jgi:hypothetical protein
MAKRRAPRPQEPPADAPAAQEPDAASVSLLPMEIAVGDRFTEHGHEWEVLTRPEHMHGGKTLRARVARSGLPETERQVTWAAHDRLAIRRSPTSAA